MFLKTKKILRYILSKHERVLLISLVSLSSVLLWRNPFSTRTLIPNFEPFPDAFYYVTPPLCWLNGEGWRMCRLGQPEIEGIETVVTPLYSISLLPSLLLFDDARSFYFSNVSLAILSVIFIYSLLQKLHNNSLLSFSITFLYVSNIYFYWLPTIPMAENLLLALFIFSGYILLLKNSWKKSLLLVILGVSFFATKKSAAPIAVSMLLTVMLSEILRNDNFQIKLLKLLSYVSTFFLGLAMLSDLSPLLSILRPLSNEVSSTISTQDSNPGYFSVSYIEKHSIEYLSSLIGSSVRFLWRYDVLVSKFIAIPAFIGYAHMALKQELYQLKEHSLVFFYISALAFQLTFMSTFYVVDMRYIIIWLPVALIGLSFFLQRISKKLVNTKQLIFWGILFLVIFINSAVRLKDQAVLNLKYAETPWWYISITELNAFIAENHPEESDRPTVITLVTPFMTDYFQSGLYDTLPLDSQQDFRGSKEKVWGDRNYDDLHTLYDELSQNNSVYVARYGIEGSDAFRDSFYQIEQKFNLTLVHEGCHTLCNIYKLNTKEE